MTDVWRLGWPRWVIHTARVLKHQAAGEGGGPARLNVEASGTLIPCEIRNLGPCSINSGENDVQEELGRSRRFLFGNKKCQIRADDFLPYPSVDPYLSGGSPAAISWGFFSGVTRTP